MISILQLGSITSCTDSTLKFLRSQAILRNGKFCDQCDLWMKHVTCSEAGDGYFWRCPNCKRKASVREGSFFEKQRLSLSVLLTILYFFSSGTSPTDAIKMLKGAAHPHSVYDWYNLYRDIMSRALIESPVRIGGVGVTVEIDESKWGYKRKYNRGRLVKEGTWIFGIIERGTGKVALFTCSTRSAEELIPKINKVVLPGTSIMSDEWAAYRSLSQQGYHHTTVNHTENFVDPVTGCHIQTIESFWANSKVHFKEMHGVKDSQLPAHLDETMFRWNNKKEDMFSLMLRKIAHFYPVEETNNLEKLKEKPAIIYNSDKHDMCIP